MVFIYISLSTELCRTSNSLCVCVFNWKHFSHCHRSSNTTIVNHIHKLRSSSPQQTPLFRTQKGHSIVLINKQVVQQGVWHKSTYRMLCRGLIWHAVFAPTLCNLWWWISGKFLQIHGGFRHVWTLYENTHKFVFIHNNYCDGFSVHPQ